MAFCRKLLAFSPAILVSFISLPSFPQQSNFQMSLLSPSASGGSFGSLGIFADIVETRNESYLQSVERSAAEKNITNFQPSSSDLLIEQAEQRFKSGKKYYRVKDTDHARTEFDTAVDLMIQASTNPTNR